MNTLDACKTVCNILNNICHNFGIDTDKITMNPNENNGFTFLAQVPYKFLAERCWSDTDFANFCAQHNFSGNIFFTSEDHVTFSMMPSAAENTVSPKEEKEQKMFPPPSSSEMETNINPNEQTTDINGVLCTTQDLLSLDMEEFAKHFDENVPINEDTKNLNNAIDDFLSLGPDVISQHFGGPQK